MSKLSGHLLIPPFYVDATASGVNFYAIVASQDGLERGAMLRLFRAGLSSVFCLGDIYGIGTTNHKLRPGWWAPFTPDDTSGASAGAAGNINSYSWTTGYVAWVLPAGVPTMDKLSIYFPSFSDPIDVVRIRSGTPTTIASNVTPGGGYQTCVPVTLSSTIQAGDTVKFVRNAAGTCGVCTWAAYDSAGTPDMNDSHHWIPEDWNLDLSAMPKGAEDDRIGVGSSTECAYQVAATGSTPQWVGGETHNDGTVNCAEVSVTESWTKAGGAWTPVPGYHIGTIVLTRSSSVRYTDGSTILGTLSSTYTLRACDLEVTTLFTAGITLDVGNLYIAMFDQSLTNIHDDQGNSVLSSGSNTFDVANRMLYAEPKAGSGFYQSLVFAGTLAANFNSPGGKWYFRHPTSNTNGVTASTTWGGTWHTFVDTTTGKTKPTLACAVGTDGLTVTVTVTSLAPTTPGTTGVTIKRGGSALTVDSKTNNGDGTITYTLNALSKVYIGDTITFDFASGNITDTYNVAPASVTGGSVTNNSTQSSATPSAIVSSSFLPSAFPASTFSGTDFGGGF